MTFGPKWPHGRQLKVRAAHEIINSPKIQPSEAKTQLPGTYNQPPDVQKSTPSGTKSFPGGIKTIPRDKY